MNADERRQIEEIKRGGRIDTALLLSYVREMEATVAKYRGLEEAARNWYINDRSVESFKAFADALAALEGK